MLRRYLVRGARHLPPSLQPQGYPVIACAYQERRADAQYSRQVSSLVEDTVQTDSTVGVIDGTDGVSHIGVWRRRKALIEVLLRVSGESIVTNQTPDQATETITAEEAVAIVCTLHDELGIEGSSITSERADKLHNKAGAPTTTEVLLLLARFHADVEDAAGAEMLARFAVEFAALEAPTV